MNQTQTHVSGASQTPPITDNQAEIIYTVHRELGLNVGQHFTLADLPPQVRSLNLSLANLFSEGHLGCAIYPDDCQYWLTPSALTAYDAWARRSHTAPRVVSALRLPVIPSPAEPVVPNGSAKSGEAWAILSDVYTMCALHLRRPSQSHKAFIADLHRMLTQITTDHQTE